MPQVKRFKRFSFTLLELMVCIALIALLATLAGFKGVDLLAHHRFYSGLQSWLGDLHRFQLVAMNHGVDIVCSIEKNQQGGYQATWMSDSPSLPRISYELGEVSSFFLDGKHALDWKMTLFSSGYLAPAGILKIEPKKRKEASLFLDLSYPIAFQTTLPQTSQSFYLPPYPQKPRR